MVAPLNTAKAFVGMLKEYEPHYVSPAVWESEMAAGTACSWVIARVDGVAVRPTGVQLCAMTVNRSSMVLPPLAVAVRMTLNVPACVRSDPERAMLVPSTLMKDGSEFRVYKTVSAHAGV